MQGWKVQAPGRGREEKKADEKHAGAAARHQKIQQTAFPCFCRFVIEHHQEIRRDGGQFPGDEKKQNVLCGEDQGQRQEQQIQKVKE